jgi:protein-S-isoprenylcysteine O-methyltransferase Ste14/multisubunit Na+/H+ antiporter MnhB subunit
MSRHRDRVPKPHNAPADTQQADVLTDIPFATPPASGNWVTDYAWVCGVIGAVVIVLCAMIYNQTHALSNGVYLFGVKLTHTPEDSILLALVVTTGSMLLAELVRLWLRDKQNFFKLNPDLESGRYSVFLLDSLINWLLYLGLFKLVVLFFHTAGEYGYAQSTAYYQPWFRFLDLAFNAYLYGGFAYVLITRAFKHDPIADRRDFSSLAARILWFAASLVPGFKNLRPQFNEIDKKAARALLVKLFFTPLMTVFFASQFPHLVSNVGYLGDGLPAAIANGSYTHARFNNDLFNISIALIFSIDVALAWCGYVISSRWVDNQTVTAEPTMLGWLVCICCYPPFQMFLSLYYSSPSERAFLQFPSQTIISIFTIMMVLSYIVYMSATLWFGVRFSNLTNRGIIRKGPFAFIRHPAYASKNFSWWCVMFPFVIYSATHSGLTEAILQTLGLVLMTWFYYLRAITEERHLSVDPYYREYCKQVKYRFIPGVI